MNLCLVRQILHQHRTGEDLKCNKILLQSCQCVLCQRNINNKILSKIVIFTPKIDFCSLAASRSVDYWTLKETLTLLSAKILQIKEKGVTKSSRIDGCVRNEK